MTSRFLVIYPYPSLDTNPTMRLLLQVLAEQHGASVDVMMPSEGSFLTPNNLPPGVGLLHLDPDFFTEAFRFRARGFPRRMAERLLPIRQLPPYPVRFDPTIFQRVAAGRYAACIGVDPVGVVLAAHLFQVGRRPLVYLSFEILCLEDIHSAFEIELKQREQEACQSVGLVLVQDDERADALHLATGIPKAKMVHIPVAPLPAPISKSDYLRCKLGIPPDRRIVLSCGNLEDAWSGRDLFREMITYWPEQFCLVLHQRSRVTGRSARAFQDLCQAGRIYFSDQPVPNQDLTSLVASADFGLAMYRPSPANWWSNKNLYYLGLSSGKVANYALCGLPILASDLPTFRREFACYDCGRTFQRISDTGDQLAELDRDYQHHSREATRFYNERLNPTKTMEQFCTRLMNLLA